MKINFSIKSAVFAAAAAMCGAVFFASPAQAQTPISLNFEAKRVEGGLATWALISYATESGGSGTFVDFGSADNNEGVQFVLFADLYSDAQFSFARPFGGFSDPFNSASTTSNRVRIAGISGGTATVVKTEQLLSVNIDDLTNVLSLTVTPAELSFQWQTRTGSSGNFADAATDGTNQTYTLASGDEGRIQITDNAGLSMFAPIAAAAAVTPPVQTCAGSAPTDCVLVFENGRLRITGNVGATAPIWSVYTHEAATGGTRQFLSSATFGSGVDFYSVPNLLTMDFDFTRPFFNFGGNNNINIQTNRVRIAGLGGSATVDKSGLVLSVNIAALTNVLAQTVNPWELSYQWQTNAGSSWQNAATMQTYTIAANTGGRVILTDKAGLRDVQTIEAVAAPAPPASALALSMSIGFAGQANNTPQPGTNATVFAVLTDNNIVPDDATYEWVAFARNAAGNGADLDTATTLAVITSLLVIADDFAVTTPYVQVKLNAFTNKQSNAQEAAVSGTPDLLLIAGLLASGPNAVSGDRLNFSTDAGNARPINAAFTPNLRQFRTEAGAVPSAEMLTYIWQSGPIYVAGCVIRPGNSGNSSCITKLNNADWVSIGMANALTITPANVPPGRNYLRLVGVDRSYTGDGGRTVISNPSNLQRITQGPTSNKSYVSVLINSSDELVYSVNFAAVSADIIDGNGVDGGTIKVRWLATGRRTGQSFGNVGGTTGLYTLVASDFETGLDDGNIRAQFLFVDPFGYEGNAQTGVDGAYVDSQAIPVNRRPAVILNSGAVSVSVGGYTMGAEWTANLNGLRDTAGNVPPPGGVRYQWQSGAAALAADDGWANISGANAATYLLARNDFAADRLFLRLVVRGATEVSSSSLTLTTAATSIAPQLGGRAGINDSAGTGLGDILTASEGGLTPDTDIGISGIFYQWYGVDADGMDIILHGATGAALTLPTSKWQYGSVAVAASYAGLLFPGAGVRATQALAAEVLDSPATGNLFVRDGGFDFGSGDEIFFAVTSSVVDADGDIGAVDYIWQVNDGAGGWRNVQRSFVVTVTVTNSFIIGDQSGNLVETFVTATQTVYTEKQYTGLDSANPARIRIVPGTFDESGTAAIVAAWNPDWTSLRVEAVVEAFTSSINNDGNTIIVSGGRTQLTSPGLELPDAPAVGELGILLTLADAASEDGQSTITLTVAVADTDDITDGNVLYENRVFTYQWYGANGDALAGETEPFYIIPATVHAAIVAGSGAPYVVAMLHDALGNSVAFTATIGLVGLDIGLSDDGLRITSNISDPAGVASSFTYQWLAASVVGGVDAGEYTPISGARSDVYSLPSNYYETTTRPFVRLSASFAVSGGNMALLSPPVNIVALTGAVALRGDGGEYGDVYTADVSGLRDVAGSAPASGAFAYEWYASAAPGAREFSAGGGRLEVAGAAVSLATYTLTPGVDVVPNPGFDVTLKRGGVGALGFGDIVLSYLRVTLSHKSSGYEYVAAAAESATGEATTAVPNYPTEGAAYTVRPGTSGVYGDGQTTNEATSFEIITSGITDNNGLGEFTWYWVVDRGNGRPNYRGAAKGNKFTLDGTNERNTTDPYFRVLAGAAHQDAFGFENQQAQIDVRLSGVPDDLTGGSIFRQLTNIDVAFVITMSLNVNPTGLPVVDFLGTVIAAGTTLSVNVDDINDANDAIVGDLAFGYQWVGANGQNIDGGSGNSQTYTLTGDDATAINAGNPLQVVVLYRDRYGVQYTFPPLIAQELRFSLSINASTSTREVTPVLENPDEADSVTTYQWTRYNGDGSSPVVSAENSSVYTLPGDITDKPLLALRINYTNAAGDARIAWSPQLRVAGAIFVASSTINITAATAADVRTGAVWRASTNIRDLFGDAADLEDLAYQWQSNTATTGGGWRTIGDNSPAYTVQAADFASNAENNYLRLRVTDAAGFSAVRLTSRVVNLLSVLAASPIVGGVTLSGQNYLNGNFKVDASEFVRNNGLATVVGYQIQRGVTLTLGSVPLDWQDFPLASSDGAGVNLTTGVFRLAHWDGEYAPLLRAAVTVRGVGIDGVTVLYSEGVSLNVPTQGTPRIRLASGGGITAGARLIINLGELSDRNDGAPGFVPGRVRYLWTEADGTPLEVLVGDEGTVTIEATEQTYVLRPADVVNINNGEALQAQVGYIDGLGFSRQWAVGGLGVLALVESIEVSAVLNGLVVSAAINASDSLIAGSEFVWQNSHTKDRFYENTEDGARRGSTYTIDAAERHLPFRRFLRAELRYTLSEAAGGGAATALSNPVRVAGLDSATTLVITSTATSDERAGIVYSALTDEVRDVSGNADITLNYEWQTGYSSQLDSSTLWLTVANNGNALYTLAQDDFADGRTELRLRIWDSINVFDGFGSNDDVIITSERVNARAAYVAALGGVVTLSGNDYSVDGTITANLSGFATSSENGALVTTYQWEAFNADNQEWDTWQASSQTLSLFVLNNSSWDGATFPSLRAVVLLSDDFGSGGRVVSDAINLNIPTEGTPLLAFVNGGAEEAGATVSVDISGISDGNNGTEATPQRVSYAWLEADGSAKTDGGNALTGETYTLTAQDITNITSNESLQMSITYVDRLGYQRVYLLRLSGFEVNIGLNGTRVTLDVEDRGNVANPATYGYQWQQSSTPNGVYSNIVGAIGNAFNVAEGYDAGFPFVRVSLSYRLSEGGANAFALSSPVRVAGLVSGTVGISGAGNYQIRSQYRAVLTNFVDFVGRAAHTSAVTYQWQTGGTANVGVWQDISGATSQIYRLATADFDNGRSSLRVVVADRAEYNSSSVTLESAGANVNRDTTGNIVIRNVGGIAVSGATYSSNETLRDSNGANPGYPRSILKYQWTALRGSSEKLIPTATLDVYTLDATDFPDGSNEGLSLQLEATYIDAFGFQFDFTAVASLTRADSTGNVAVGGTALSPTTDLIANVNVQDANGLGTFTYEWQGGTEAGIFTGLSATNSVYTFSSWNTAHVSIRVIATHADAFGDTTPFTSAARAVNLPTGGTPRLEFVNNAALATGVTLSVNSSDVTDANGARNTAYAWQSQNGGTESTYVLAQEDVNNINARTPTSVTITFTDGLGFTRSWTLFVQAVLADIGLDGANVTSGITDPDNIVTGEYRYQWQQSATETGAFTNINANGALSIYAVPANYDANRVFVRLSLSYAPSAGGARLPVLSTPLRVAGLVSGTLAADRQDGNGYAAGSSYRAILTNLRDVLGRPPHATALTYRWQTGTDSSGSGVGAWSDISGATSQTYVLAPGSNFTNNRSFLRVLYSDRARSGAAEVESRTINIQQASTGTVGITFDPATAFRVGGVYTADTGNITDANGIGSFAYVWSARSNAESGAFAVLAGEIGATYILQSEDFANGTNPSLRVSVLHTDAFGFETGGFEDEAELQQDAPDGNVQITTASDNYTLNAVFGVDSAGLIDINGGTVTVAQWGRILILNGPPEFNALSGETGATFTLSTWGGQRSLAVRAVHTDGFNVATTVSAYFNLNQPTQGTPRLVFVNNAAPQAGVTVSVDTSGITDANGAGTFAYSWTAVSGGTGATYVLVQTDVDNINAGRPPSVQVTHTDALNYQREWTVVVQAVLPEIRLDGATALVTVLDPTSIADAATYQYQWQQSATENGAYTPIASQTGTAYVVPTGYDAGRVFLRLSLGYQRTAGAGGPTLPGVSAPIRVAGIASGVVTIVGEGVAQGDIYTAAITGLVDVLGRTPEVDAVTYQWEGTSNTASWNTLSGATLQTYALNTADLNNQRYVRVVATDRAENNSSSVTLTAETLDIYRSTTGTLSIAVAANAGGEDSAPGAVYSADSSDLSDANGADSSLADSDSIRQYQWTAFRGSAEQIISSVTVAAYTVNAVDFPSGTGELSLRLVATYQDAFGFQQGFTAAATLVQAESSGEVLLDGAALSPTTNLTANAQISDANGAGTTTYEWQGGTEAGAYTLVNSSATEGDVFESSTWNTANVSIRVIATHADAFGDTTAFTSTARAVNVPTDGTPRTEFVNNVSPVTGATARVNTSGITDDNGAGPFAYSWKSEGGGTEEEYILQAEDVTAINSGTPPEVTVTFTDGLGFMRSWTLELVAVRAEIGLDGATVTANITDPSSIADSASYVYQWQQSASRFSGFENITTGAVATDSTYVVPTEYDENRIWIRLSLGYMRTGGSDILPALSAPVRVAGLVARAPVITVSNGDGFAAGSTYELVLSAFVDVLGRAPDENDLTYVWQSGDGEAESDPGWRNIDSARGRGRVYTLNMADFADGARPYLRVAYSDRGRGGAEQSMRGILVNSPSEGTVGVNFSDPDSFRYGGTYTAVITNITDANGVGTFRYAWFAKPNDSEGFTQISFNTAAILILPTLWFANGTNPTLRLSVDSVDEFGFVTDGFTYDVAVEQRSPSGNIQITPPADGDYDVGAEFGVSNNLTDINGNGSIQTYQWGRLTATNGAFVNISGANEATYTLPANWPGTGEYLAVSVVYADAFLASTTLSAALRVNQPTQGAPRTEFVNNGAPAAGATVSVNISEISDRNGGDAFAYAWSGENGGTDATYTLTADDVVSINAGTPPDVTVTYTDDLGFVQSWTLDVSAIRVDVALRDALASATIVDENDVAVSTSYKYQWQQSATGAGDWTNISGETRVSYTVPPGYDATRLFVRLSLSYVQTEGGNTLPAFSRAVRVAGLASGAVTMDGSGFAAGASYNANLSNLRDVLGQTAVADAVTYQWQTGTSADAGWTPISGATLQTYALSTANFTNARRFLRVVLGDRAGNSSTSATLTATGRDINVSLSGVLGITKPSNANMPGAVFTANPSGVTDGNRLGTVAADTYAYTWFAQDSSGTRDIGTGATYTLATVNFAGMVAPSFGLRAVVTDVFGFVGTITAASVGVDQQNPTGLQVSSGDNYAPGAVFTATAIDINGAGTLSDYVWLQGKSETGAFTPFASAERGTTYVLAAGEWPDGNEYLRLSVVHTDPFGATTTLTSEPQLINQPTQGTVEISGGENVAAGVVVSANVALTDENNGTAADAQVAYRWINGAGSQAGTNSTYTLTEADVTATIGVRLEVTYTDGIGFSTTHTATLESGSLLEEKEYVEKIGAVLNLVETNAVLGVLGSHLDGRLARGGDGLGATGSFFEINGRRFEGRKDIAAALAARTANSRNKGKTFALDSFSWQSYGGGTGEGAAAGEGGGGGAAWSTWLKGGWAVLEGEPVVDGKVFKYEGESFGVYGGYDRQFGDLRAGLAVGHSEVELKVDLDPNTSDGADRKLDDKALRRLNSLLPYVEWNGEDGRLRLIGGYGLGVLEVEEVKNGGGCTGEVDTDWRFGALSGEYSLLEGARWGASMLGNVSYADSNSEVGKCGTKDVAAARSTAGEWLLGARVEFDGGTESGAFSPRVGVDARRPFGDVKDDLAYDFVGGLAFGRASGGLSFDMEGKTQLNDVTHRRDALSGRLRYTSGGISSSWRTEMGMEDGSRNGLTHRWELGYTGEWGINSLGTNVYVERVGAAATESALGLGAEFRLNF